MASGKCESMISSSAEHRLRNAEHFRRGTGDVLKADAEADSINVQYCYKMGIRQQDRFQFLARAFLRSRIS